MVGPANSVPLVFLDGTTVPVDGHTLNFAGGTLYVVNIGDVGNGLPDAVAAAANRAYVVADTNGIAVTAVKGGMGGITPGEHLIFMGQDQAGRTEYWWFGSTDNAVGGFVPATSLFNSADINGNHQVDPGEIHRISDLLGAIPTHFFGELG
jgi:hypothetical protein